MTDNAAYKQDVHAWTRDQLAIFKRNVGAMTNKGKADFLRANRQKLIDSIRYKIVHKFDTPERILFPFAKHGFFIAVGASKGHSYKKNPRAVIDWYNSTLNTGVETLADIVAKHDANAAVKIAGGIGK